jgi:hypothetical protein
MRAAGALAVAALAAAAVPFLQRKVDAAVGPYRAQEEVLYLWRGSHVKTLFPGFEHLAADVYWLRTVQYFGSERVFAADKRFELLYPLIEITTTLDPRMEIAYRYGAVFLAERVPIGAGRPDLAVRVLEGGVRNNPASWRLRQELGFFHFIYLDDAKRAAEILVEASRLPGAAFWLKSLAAEVLVKGGHGDVSRRMWQEMYDQSEGAMKENARVHLLAIDAATAAQALTTAVRAFTARSGRPPRDLGELRASGLAGGPIVDPIGMPFEYDVGTGQVTVSRKSYLRREDLGGGAR